ncbi:inositol hexakisphosphate and diphosphoinositol-pentakisphosphate kinase 1 isoform X1, partial [Tachysurus ichikawai]
NQDKQENLGSLEDLSQDEPDRVVLTEHPSVQRKSPLIRNRKTGSMEVLSESTTSSRGAAYRLFPSCSRQPCEVKSGGLGSLFSGLFSSSFRGVSSSAPNLRELARTQRKKAMSPQSRISREELLSMPAVKRFSVSYARHPTNESAEKQHYDADLLTSVFTHQPHSSYPSLLLPPSAC